MSGLLTAARYLTIVPFPGPAQAGIGAVGRAAAWFPIVGAGLGVGLALLDRLAGAVFPPILSVLLTVTGWKLATGGLHLDGLADCLDGLIGKDAEHRLAIMRDSRIGAFGAVGLILFLMLEIAALGELTPAVRGAALLAAPVIGRATPALLARLFPPAREDGQGASFRAALSSSAPVIGLAAALAVSVVALAGAGAAALAVGVATALGVAVLLARRLGGITGDVMGAGIEVAELAALLTVCAWTRARL